MESYHEAGIAVPLPDVHAGRYLIEALMDVGPVKSDPMAGPSVVPWTEIAGYREAGGIISEPWECRAVRDMSAAFLRGLREGENPLSIMPIERDIPLNDR